MNNYKEELTAMKECMATKWMLHGENRSYCNIYVLFLAVEVVVLVEEAEIFAVFLGHTVYFVL